MDLHEDLDGLLRDTALGAAEGRSPARARQLLWVAGELSRYAAAQPAPPPLPELLGAPHVTRYLAAAAAGELRVRAAAPRAPSAASTRVRVDCVALMARHAGLAAPEVDRTPPPPLAPRLDTATGREAGAALRTAARHGRPLATWVRHTLVVELVADTGMRVGELAALEVGDVDLDARTVTYVPRPPAGRATLAACTVPLSPATVRAAHEWLAVRADLTTLAPRTTALLVSVHGNHDGDGARRPPGLPLRSRGLARAHRGAVAALNARRATAEPLPARLGAMRPDPGSTTARA